MRTYGKESKDCKKDSIYIKKVFGMTAFLVLLERMKKMSQISCCIHGNDGNKGCVSSVPIFNHLEEEQLNDVMKVVQSKTYRRGEYLFHAGSESDSLFIVNSVREKLFLLLHPGDFTGELALFKATVLENHAEAMVDSNICVIKRNDLQQLLLKYPTISIKVLNEFANRLANSEKQTASFVSETVETRIALFLTDLVEDNGNKLIELPMSKKDVASYLGTTPETLSRRLTDFETKGIIKQKGQRKIEIVDEDRLLHV